MTELPLAPPPPSSPLAATPEATKRPRSTTRGVCDGCNVGVQRPEAPRSNQWRRHGNQRQPARQRRQSAERSAPFCDAANSSSSKAYASLVGKNCSGQTPSRGTRRDLQLHLLQRLVDLGQRRLGTGGRLVVDALHAAACDGVLLLDDLKPGHHLLRAGSAPSHLLSLLLSYRTKRT